METHLPAVSAASGDAPMLSSDNSTVMTIHGRQATPSTTQLPSPTIASKTPSTANPPVSKIPDSVDSALLSALHAGEPRERLGLLKLEQALLDFLKQPSARSVDVGGPYNSVLLPSATQDQRSSTSSFQRCLLHRLCDRFHLTRETLENGFIRVHKTQDTAIPSQLLLNLTTATTTASSEESPASNSTATRPPSKAKRKMKIMKRASSNLSTASNSSSNSNSTALRKKSPQDSLSDKEKKYAEARARIMGTAAEDAAASTSSLTPTPASDSDKPLDDGTAAASNFKATYRNQRVEANDPDFIRGGSRRMNATSNAQVFYPPATQQQAPPPRMPSQPRQQVFYNNPPIFSSLTAAAASTYHHYHQYYNPYPTATTNLNTRLENDSTPTTTSCEEAFSQKDFPSLR